MSGWDSLVRDPKAVKFQRNRSLTKEEIDTYWRSKKKKEEQHPPNLSHGDDDQAKANTGEQSDKNYNRSSSFPPPSIRKGNLVDTLDPHCHQERMEKLLKKNGWWISSNWAFLNEPPVILTEAPTYKYASQFHVANRRDNSNSHPTTNTISTN